MQTLVSSLTYPPISTEGARVKQAGVNACPAGMEQAVGCVASCFTVGGNLLVCSNGGKPADCPHIAAKSTSVLLRRAFPRPSKPAIALKTDTSFLTARDYGFDGIFLLVQVCDAMPVTHQLGLRTIVVTGGGGGKLASHSNLTQRVPRTKVQDIHEKYVAIGHVLWKGVEVRLFPRAGGTAL